MSLRHCLPILLAGCAIAAPSSAQFRGWGGPPDAFPSSRWPAGRRQAADDQEGRVEVARFLATGVALSELGHGGVVVATLAESGGDEREQATFEAAVIDRLIAAGYDSMPPTGTAVQRVELRVVQEVARDQEPARKPVSGQMGVELGSRGSSMSMALNIDLSKPRKALISSRLEARIKDASTGELLWEGRATMLARDEDEHWTTQAIAEKLAAALFDEFTPTPD